jgi:hypothetical protein
VLVKTLYSNLAPFDPDNGPVYGFPFVTRSSGTIDVEVNFTFPTSVLGLVLISEASCPLDGSQSCDALAISDSGAKPETLLFGTAPPGSYTLLVVNLGTETEAGTVDIGITNTAGTTSGETSDMITYTTVHRALRFPNGN